jgi:hydroxyacylglutathione hydrolase
VSQKIRPRIYPVRLGIAFAYILKGEATIMIDAGAPKHGRQFLTACQRFNVIPEEIDLIVLTHGHWDHIGSAREIQDLTGAEIALHEQEIDCLEGPFEPEIHGATTLGRIMAGAIRVAGRIRNHHIRPARVDIRLHDGLFPLAPYGIPGKIIHTPGHSPGSVSVLLDSGDALVGDMAMGSSPFGLGPGVPMFAEDLRQLKASWKKVLHAGAKTLYPAHGKRFPASMLAELLHE